MESASRKRLVFVALGAMVLLAVLHFSALTFFLYWRFPWFDLITHFLGGAVIGLGALWLVQVYEIHTGLPLSNHVRLAVVVICALGIGGAWEVFELTFKLFDPDNYAFDTSIDLVMDTLGAVMAWKLTRTAQEETVPE
jgi:hypothetical protein